VKKLTIILFIIVMSFSVTAIAGGHYGHNRLSATYQLSSSSVLAKNYGEENALNTAKEFVVKIKEKSRISRF